MRRYAFLVGVMTSLLLTMASIAYASSNLNLSKSNINRLVHPPVVTPAQAAAILKELDQVKLGGAAEEATVRAIVQKHIGAVKSARGQNLIIIIRPADGPRKFRSILILENAADEAAAIAVSDPGMPAGGYEKSTKGKTSTK
jgi:hypothetical protein